jgi:hypothetical protein
MVNININFSNKWLYMLIVIGIFGAIGVGVSAYGTSNPATMGHSFGEIELPDCEDEQVLKFSGTGWDCSDASDGDADSLGGISSNGFMRAITDGEYYGLKDPAGSTANWIRTTTAGIIPSIPGGASALGTPTWPFNSAHIKTITFGDGTSMTTAPTASGDVTFTSIKIGSTNPNFKLAVHTTTKNGLLSETTSWGGIGLYGVNYHADGFGVMGAGGSYDFFAVGAGTNYGASSSIRWKNNITLIEGALDKVLALEGVYYDWDEEHGGIHDMGFIAEDVGLVVPEIVGFENASNESNWYVDDDGNTKLYATGVDYGALTPVLVEAIKEQQKQIEELKLRIEILEN